MTFMSCFQGAHTSQLRWDVTYGARIPQIQPGYAWMSRLLADRNSSVSNTPWRRKWWGPELARARMALKNIDAEGALTEVECNNHS